MKIIKLLHPEIGLCAQAVVDYNNSEAKIKYGWSKKYGQKYKVCTTETFDDKIDKPFHRAKF